jgi:hypothetical protein
MDLPHIALSTGLGEYPRDISQGVSDLRLGHGIIYIGQHYLDSYLTSRTTATNIAIIGGTQLFTILTTQIVLIVLMLFPTMLRTSFLSTSMTESSMTIESSTSARVI